MTWKLLAAGAAGLVLANLADWLFAGVLFHERYRTYPEVWRTRGANPRALIAAQVMTVPTVAGLIALLLWTGRTSMGEALVFAALVWAIAAAPAILANGLFVKLDVRVVAPHRGLAGETGPDRRRRVADPARLSPKQAISPPPP